MADVTAEVSVSVERVIHDAMREVAEKIWEKHRICVHDVRFAWYDVSSTEGANFKLRSVAIDSTTVD